jgi:hypothetical protein
MHFHSCGWSPRLRIFYILSHCPARTASRSNLVPYCFCVVVKGLDASLLRLCGAMLVLEAEEGEALFFTPRRMENGEEVRFSHT